MASLWAVRDQATAELMARFYQAYLRDGLTPAAALLQAQRALRARSRAGAIPTSGRPSLCRESSAGAAHDKEGEEKRSTG